MTEAVAGQPARSCRAQAIRSSFTGRKPAAPVCSGGPPDCGRII